MPTVIVQRRPLRDAIRALRQFDGRGYLWRVPLALATYVAMRAIPIGAAVAIALVTVRGRVAEAILSACIALGFEGLRNRLRVRLPWRAAIDNRLWSFEKPNPSTEVPIYLREDHVLVARTALRRGRFNPQVYGLRTGSPPQDARELTYKIGVHEPEAWPQSSSDRDRVRRMVEILKEARIRARVAGIDVFSDGTAATDQDFARLTA